MESEPRIEPETIEVARRKEMPSCVRFKTMDAYTFAELGDRRFDGAFTGCGGATCRWANLRAGLMLSTRDSSPVHGS